MIANAVDRAEVRVVQRACRASFALEPLQRLRADDETAAQELERDLAPQARVFGLVHDAHATFAELAEHTKVGDRLPGERLIRGGACVMRHEPCRHFDGRCFDERAGGSVVAEQRFHFGAQRGIAAAGLLEKSLPLGSGEQRCLVVQLLDPAAVVSFHADSDRAREAATPWRASSRASPSPARCRALRQSRRP